MRRASPTPSRPTRCRGEGGQLAGIEVVPFGVLVFVVGALLVANAWAVVDAKLAVSAAARAATRAYVESPAGHDPFSAAEDAAGEAMSGVGRDPGRLDLTMLQGGLERCRTVRFQASYRVPAVVVPWVGGFGAGLTASARHAEVVDPYRTGLGGTAPCRPSP